MTYLPEPAVAGRWGGLSGRRHRPPLRPVHRATLISNGRRWPSVGIVDQCRSAGRTLHGPGTGPSARQGVADRPPAVCRTASPLVRIFSFSLESGFLLLSPTAASGHRRPKVRWPGPITRPSARSNPPPSGQGRWAVRRFC